MFKLQAQLILAVANLVQILLQHRSASITQRYIGIEPQRIEKAIEGHAQLM